MVESNKMMEKLRNGQVSIGSMIRCGSPLWLKCLDIVVLTFCSSRRTLAHE